MRYSDLLEESFENFLEQDAYERSNEYIFKIIREAYCAGWKDAFRVINEKRIPIGFPASNNH